MLVAAASKIALVDETPNYENDARLISAILSTKPRLGKGVEKSKNEIFMCLFEICSFTEIHSNVQAPFNYVLQPLGLLEGKVQ